MIFREPTTSRKACLTGLIVALSLLAAYLCFISLVTLSVGFRHMDRLGFWVPILAGAIALATVIWIFLRAVKRVLSEMKDEDMINV